jgi:hypothetical protein
MSAPKGTNYRFILAAKANRFLSTGLIKGLQRLSGQGKVHQKSQWPLYSSVLLPELS